MFRICVAEDLGVELLKLPTSVGPMHQVTHGRMTQLARILETFCVRPQPGALGFIVRSHLAESQRLRTPAEAVNDRHWLGVGPVLVVNARWVPPLPLDLPEVSRPLVGLCDGHPACAWVGPGQAVGLATETVDVWFDMLLDRLPIVEVGGHWIGPAPRSPRSSMPTHIREFSLAGRAAHLNLPPGQPAATDRWAP